MSSTSSRGSGAEAGAAPAPLLCSPWRWTAVRHTSERAASGSKIGLVFNVAGVLHDAAQKKGPERALREVDAEWMMHVYAVNAVGPVVCTQALAPSLAKGAVVANDDNKTEKDEVKEAAATYRTHRSPLTISLPFAGRP